MGPVPDIPLNALRAVEAVARLGSLRAAAAALQVTPGAVSQHLRRAEDGLGVALFDRTPQGLTLTATGRAMAADLGRGFALLEQAVAQASARPRDALTASVAPVFASKWLVWRMQAFARAHPELSLRIEATVELADLRRGGADVAIRVGQGGWPGVRARRLADQVLFPVCCPPMAETVRRARDLRALPVVRDINGGDPWPDWWRATGQDGPPPDRPGPLYSDGALCLDAAIAGQGLFMGWPTLAGDAIAQGRLVRPLPGTLRTGQAYWLVTAEGRLSPELRALHDWLRAELATSYAELGLDIGADGRAGRG